MREILFRAWYKGTSFPVDADDLEDYEKPQMVYDVQNLYDGSGTSNSDVLGGYSSFGGILADDRFELMQYTGLKDKNGKRIYEGDVLRYVKVAGHTSTGVVKYVTEFARWEYWHTQQKEGFPVLSDHDNMEIIGNIHDNPELLNA